MDKSWMNKSRSSAAYMNGVSNFIKFATEKTAVNGSIYCPCKKCYNRFSHDARTVREHLIWTGMLEGYRNWIFHGESAILSSSNDQPTSSNATSSTRQSNVNGQFEIQGLLATAFGIISEDNQNVDSPSMNSPIEMENNEAPVDDDYPQNNLPTENDGSTRFQQLIQECDEVLYPECTGFSKISFILRLYHIKCLSGWSGSSFSMLLELLLDAFPKGTNLPSSYYEAKKLIKELGLGYEKIDACPNDCSLYWGEKKNNESCDVCLTSRWVVSNENKNELMEDENGKPKKKKAAKVLRYFPLIPRLKRLYMSSKTASSMRWHAEGRNKDGKLRHPADALCWTEFDKRYPEFAADPRSVRLGLASDGFNPFRTMSTTYSTWPVVMVPYNFPPWACMKQSSLILSMVIPGEKGPGNDIDVFLQPLIEELKQLWDGVDAFDAHGWSTKGRFACPSCGEATHSRWLKHGKKFCYLGHRRWLSEDHQCRYEMDQFDRTMELRPAPVPPSGTEVLRQLHGVNFAYGKATKSNQKRRRELDENSRSQPNYQQSNLDNETMHFEDPYDVDDENVEADDSRTCLWKKRSIFFDLPYWEFILLRHNLDVMHIEKNVCDNLLGTLLNVDGKSKDNHKARLDLIDMNIRPELHPNDSGRFPPACYTMSSAEKEMFLTVLKNMKVPDGYASNISRCVNLKERKIFNLKSHDCHVLMQDILPIALRSCLPRQVLAVVTDLCSIFKALCSKTLDLNELDLLESKVAETLCQLEKIFVPSFFTVMVHLTIHLVGEAKLGGPVHYRWMFPIERDLVRFKSNVRNRAHPEGSIAEGYVADECLTFCSRYLQGVETTFNRSQRNFDRVGNSENYMFSSGGRVLGKIESAVLDKMAFAQIHRYVLLHYDHISTYKSEFLANERRAYRPLRSTPRIEQKWLLEKFAEWLLNQVQKMKHNNTSEEIVSIARGPNTVIRRFGGFIVNGFRFHTKSRENLRKTQNSGVVVEVEGVSYYGVLRDIIELDYYKRFKIVMFKCDWFDISSRGVKKDANGCTLVNFSRVIHKGDKLQDDPFVFSSQAKQVFYVQDPKQKEWRHVVHTKPRDLYEMGTCIEIEDDDAYTQCMPHNVTTTADLSEPLNWVRDDIED